MATAFFASPSKLPCLTSLCPPDPIDLLNDILFDKPDSPLLCGNCEEDAKASSRCKDCDELLCDNCMRAHGLVRLTKDHCIISLGDSHISSFSSRSSSSNGTTDSTSLNSFMLSNSEKKCDAHLSDTMMFCENCGVFCKECYSLEHKGHHCVPMNEALECVRSANIKFMSEAKFNAMAIKESLEEVQRMSRTLASRSQIISQQIKNVMQRYYMAIKERETELMEQLRYIFSQKHSEIERQVLIYKTLFSRLTQVSNELSNSMESDNLAEALQVHDSVSSELDKLRSMKRSMNQVDDCLHFVPPHSSILWAINSMGKIIGYNPATSETSSTIGGELFKTVGSTPYAFQNSNYLSDLSSFKESDRDSVSSLSLIFQETSIAPIGKVTLNKALKPLKLKNKPTYFQRDYIVAGVPLLLFGGEGDEDGKLCRPWGVCCNSEGNIIVADRSNNRIQVFRSDGTFLFKFGTHGSSPGRFDRPAGVAADTRDNIVVADKDNHRIQVFSKRGDFILTFGEKGSKLGQFNYPWDVATDPQRRIAVSDSRNHRIQLFDSDGKFLAKFGFDTSANSMKHFDSPRGVCFGLKGCLLVTDFNNHRIVVLEPNFSKAKFIGSEGSGEKQFSRPQGIAIDQAGNIVVADSRNNRIQVFEPDGSFICTFGCSGTENGQMDRPSGLCLSPRGKIVVVDFGNNRVQVF